MDDPALDGDALERIREAAAGLERDVSLELTTSETSTELGLRLQAFVSRIEDVTQDVTYLNVRRRFNVDQSPEVVIRAEAKGEIHYQAVPAGPELEPFVAALRAVGGAEKPPASSDEFPISLDVYITAHCPNCPRSVQAAVVVVAPNPNAELRVIDVENFPERAAAAGVRSVPMIVADDGLTVVGAIDEGELREKIRLARAEGGDGVIFGSLVDAGRFDKAARFLSTEGGRRVFLKRWTAGALEGRIGLALTADEALAPNDRALDALAADLLPLLSLDSAPLRGDTADLLGKIGNPDARPALEVLLDDDDEDVAEIAAEALEELRTDGHAGERPVEGRGR